MNRDKPNISFEQLPNPLRILKKNKNKGAHAVWQWRLEDDEKLEHCVVDLRMTEPGLEWALKEANIVVPFSNVVKRIKDLRIREKAYHKIFTQETDQILKDYCEAGFTMKDISERMGIRLYWISQRIKELQVSVVLTRKQKYDQNRRHQECLKKHAKITEAEGIVREKEPERCMIFEIHLLDEPEDNRYYGTVTVPYNAHGGINEAICRAAARAEMMIPAINSLCPWALVYYTETHQIRYAATFTSRAQHQNYVRSINTFANGTRNIISFDLC